MKIGVFGPHGKLGSQLVKDGAEPLECDITSHDDLWDTLNGKQFDVVINCAAFTDVERAEDSLFKQKVIAVNYKSILRIQEALDKHTHYIHLSTDYVFGGFRGPYKENTKAIQSDCPVNFYGLTKQAAEFAVSEYPRTTIVRTTGLFGLGKPDFVSLVLEHIETGEPFTVTDNLFGNQTYVPFLSADLLRLSEMGNKPAILHLASQDILSRYEFAKLILETVGKSIEIIPKPSKEIWKTPRPVHGGLDVRLAKKLGFNSYSIRDGLVDYLEKKNED